MRKLKPITVKEVKIENLELFTFLKFTTSDHDKDKSLWISTKDLKNFYLDKYLHLGINKSNVDDFLLQKDVKYKLTNEDVENFLNYYLYDNVIYKEQTYNT